MEDAESVLGPAGVMTGAAHEELNRLAELMNGGAWPQAEDQSRPLLDRYPDVGFLWKVYGVARMRQSKDARPQLQRAAQLSPQDAEAHYYLGNARLQWGQLAGALASYNRALELRPDFTEVLVALADALRTVGHCAEAVVYYHRAIELQPGSAELRNNLGNACLQLEQLDEAAASYRDALRLRPDFAAAHSNLGNVLRRAGRLDEALVSCRRALEIAPELADAHHNLGNVLLDLGEFAASAQSYRRALQINSDIADTHNNLGNALRNLGLLREARECYRRALEANPTLAQTHNNLGNVLLDLVALDEAADSYRRALALEPDYSHAHTGLAMALRQKGRAADAEACCTRALELQPRCAEALAFLGELCTDRGRFTEAEDFFKRAVALNPRLASGWAGMARSRKMGPDDGEWVQSAQRLAANRLPIRQEMNLRYAIGKYFDDLRDYERAFDSYYRANQLARRCAAGHDPQSLTCRIDRIIASQDSSWLSGLQPRGIRSPRPVFVVGMPRSGTTLAEQILASHPDVYGAGELPFWNAAADDQEASDAQGAQAEDRLSALADAYLRHLAELSPDTLRVVDKMPTNFMQLGPIHAALPNARFIHMRRNPLDTCLSIYFQNFSIFHTYANDLHHLAHYYLQYHRLMQHWRATVPEGTVLDVPYESLVDAPEVWSRRMLAFIDVPWDPHCLDFHQTERAVMTSSKWQVRQKMSRSSVGRWRNYEKFIAPLHPLMPLAEGA